MTRITRDNQYPKYSVATRAVALSQIALLFAGSGYGFTYESSGTGSKNVTTTNVPAAPGSASVTVASETQASFESPVTNTGAFVHKIPIELPPGIGEMTPELALAYSSRGGVGVAGVGWDMPYSAITLNLADGFRPGSIVEDLDRYEANVPIERYASNFGTLAVVKDAEDYYQATKTYVFNPHNDQKVEPIRDELNRLTVGGDKAAWLVSLKNGVRYRYGFSEQSSVYKDKGVAGKERKVAWLLDQVEDRHGNLMKYYYEEYPNRQSDHRQPILRAIEYGIPARDTDVAQRLVVEFKYVESPWKRVSYNLGTRTETAFLVDEICVFAKSHVDSETIAGHQSWTVFGSDDAGIEGVSRMPCTQLTYNFEDAAYADSYTGRPLLMKVQRVAASGVSTPPFAMSYNLQGIDFKDTLQQSITTAGEPWHPPFQKHPQQVSHDVQHTMADVNGDGQADVISGNPTGAFEVQLAQLDGTYITEDWANPLSTAGAVSISGSENSTKNTPKADCWHKFDYNLQLLGGGAGLAYSKTLTRAPADFWHIYQRANSFSEYETQHEPLGAFQFLRSSFYGPYPAFAKKNAFDQASFIDELETYGSYKKDLYEYAFDWRASDCKDWGDKAEIDYCWDVGTGGDGMLGADHGCFDNAGSRWFTTAASSFQGANRSYSAGLWDLTDLDGDGILDWLYAANVIAQKSDGTTRNFKSGANDWYWAKGTGSGWETPAPWHVPPKKGSQLSLGSDVDFVHGTGTLFTSVSTTSLIPQPSFGIGVNVGFGPNGIGVSPSVVLGGNAIGLPTSPGGALATGRNMAVGAAVRNAGPQAAMAYQHGSAAVASTGAIAGGNVFALMPNAGLSLTNRGLKMDLHLPIVGDVLSKYKQNYSYTTDYSYQGNYDLNGDGRADLVSARWDAGATINAPDRWLFYRNNGNGFDDPELWHFGESPAAPSGSAVTNDAISATVTDTLVKHPFDWGPQEMPFGNIQQYYGLADVNGDGLADFVDANNYRETDPASGNEHQVWLVHFNQGEDFGAPVAWKFDGDWDADHGSCSYVHGQPRISRSVYGHPNYLSGGLAFSRQVQGLTDANEDGLADFWYVEPKLQDGPGSSCGYLTSTTDISNDDELEPWVSPFELNSRLLVRLNTGSGFGPPEEWTSSAGLSLSGGVTDLQHISDPVKEAISQTVLTTGDFDNDGATELALRSRNRNSDNDYDWSLFDVDIPNPDALVSVTNPNGGLVDVTYRYKQNRNGEMGVGQWVVDQTRLYDQDATIADVTHTYRYERGVYDREHRTFLGFERVYDEVEDGYTMSRFYMKKGFEGQLYCREVRSLEQAPLALETRVSSHENVWASTAAGAIPADYVKAVAVGTPVAGAVRPSASADEDQASLDADPAGESSTGDTTDSEDRYAGDFSDPDDPAQDDLEKVRFAADGALLPAQTNPTLDNGPSPNTPSWQPSSDDSDADDSDASDNDDNPPGNWWDLPIYDDCQDGTIIIGETLFVCDPSQITDDMLVCGDLGDEGRLVKSEYFIMGDHSSIRGLAAPRLRVTYQQLYNPAGANPVVTRQERDLDDYGRVISMADKGDTALVGDEFTATTEYVAPNLVDYLVDFSCHDMVNDANGNAMRESWTGYDGGAADGSCPMPTQARATTVSRSIDGVDIATEEFAYNAEGNVWLHTDPKGNPTLSGYDQEFPWYKVLESDLIVTPTGPLLLARAWTYWGLHDLATQFGALAAEIESNGARTDYSYDDLERLTAIKKPLDDTAFPSKVIEYVDFDSGGNVQWPRKVVTKRLSTVATYSETIESIDGFGRIKKAESTPADNLAGCELGSCYKTGLEKTYDSHGRVVEERLPYWGNAATDDLRVVMTYDLLGRLTSNAGANGSTISTSYDRNEVTVQDAEGQVAITGSDVRENPLYVHEYVDQGSTHYATTSYAYSALGEMLAMTDDAGNVWSFSYDRLGRRLSIDDPNAGVHTTVYDKNGNVAVTYDARYSSSGVATRTTYDPLDRPVLREAREGTTVVGVGLSGGSVTDQSVWVYDVDPGTLAGATLTTCSGNWRGRLSRVDHYRANATMSELVSSKEFCYDEQGRVIDEHRLIHGNSYNYAYEYNAAGQLHLMKYPDGDTVFYGYDAAGRLATMTSTGHGDLLKASFVNASGMTVKRKLGSSLVERSCYEVGSQSRRLRRSIIGLRGAPTGLSVTCGETNAADVVTGTVLHDVAYSYAAGGSPASRSEGWEDPSTGWTEHDSSYDYDGRNRLVTETYDGVAEDYDYDNVGNLTNMRGVDQVYGDSSRALRNSGPYAVTETGSGYTLTYDDVGNVEEIAKGARTYNFVRNANGKAKKILKNGVNIATMLFDEHGTRVKKSTSAGDVYYAGPYRSSAGFAESIYAGIGVKVTDLSSGVSTMRFHVRDSGSSTALVIDDSGSVVQAVGYAPYGEPRFNNSAAGVFENKFLFGEKERDGHFDATEDIFDFGARLYFSNLGRWLEIDDTFVDGPNRYAYVANNPVKYRDPSGRSKTSDDSVTREFPGGISVRTDPQSGARMWKGRGTWGTPVDWAPLSDESLASLEARADYETTMWVVASPTLIALAIFGVGVGGGLTTRTATVAGPRTGVALSAGEIVWPGLVRGTKYAIGNSLMEGGALMAKNFVLGNSLTEGLPSEVTKYVGKGFLTGAILGKKWAIGALVSSWALETFVDTTNDFAHSQLKDPAP